MVIYFISLVRFSDDLVILENDLIYDSTIEKNVYAYMYVVELIHITVIKFRDELRI